MTLTTRIALASNKELNYVIKPKIFVNYLMSQENCNMKENLPKQLEKSLWEYLQDKISSQRKLQGQPQEVKSMVDLEVRTLQS